MLSGRPAGRHPTPASLSAVCASTTSPGGTPPGARGLALRAAAEGFRHRAVRQDEDEVSAAFGVRMYPTNIVVGPDGRVLYAATGYDEPAIRAAIDSTAR
jgi:hypothetical protein